MRHSPGNTLHLYAGLNIPKTSFFFFFQAEDGIRDGHVTGVQTCALPISWTTGVEEKRRPYSVVFQACGGPNAGVKLIGNSKFPRLVENTLRTFQVQETLKPDIYLPMHPETYFAGKVERIKAGETPHPLFDRDAY